MKVQKINAVTGRVYELRYSRMARGRLVGARWVRVSDRPSTGSSRKAAQGVVFVEGPALMQAFVCRARRSKERRPNSASSIA
jgi:hypothetical protein